MAKPSPEQLAIINNDSQNILVNAAPGSGKTRTLLAHAMKHGADEKVLILAFSKPAQLELVERVQHFGANRENMDIKTFHAFCLGIARPYMDNVELNPQKSRKIVWDLVKKNDVSFNTLSHEISNYQNGKGGNYKYADLIDKYQEEKDRLNIIDYDDLHPMALELLQNKKVSIDYDRVYVDEGHDLNRHQIALLRAILNPTTKLFGIMSSEQSIYRFRGADPSLLESFCEERKCEKLGITQNFRSGPEITNLASIISDVPMKPNASIKDSVDILDPFMSAFKESEAIADMIFNSKEKATILYRVHRTSAQIERSLSYRGIPFYTVESDGFFELDQIKVIIKYMRLARQLRELDFNKQDLNLLLDVVNKPFRWFSIDVKTQIEKNIELKGDILTGLDSTLFSKNRNQMAAINKKAKELKDHLIVLSYIQNPLDAIQYIRVDMKYDKDVIKNSYSRDGEEDEYLLEPMDNLEEIAEDFRDVDSFIKFVDNVHPVESPEDAQVLLMTSHASKGKEFESVYVVSNQMYPYKGFDNITDEELTEEKNLLFVACTRAKERLVISSVGYHSAFLEVALNKSALKRS